MKPFIGIVLLCLFLRSDGNANIASISFYSKQFQSSFNYLWAQAIADAPDLAYTHLSQSDEIYWLTLAAQHQNADAQWRLANKLVGQKQQDFWLQQAAQNGLLQAQLLLAKRWKKKHPQLAHYWLAQAALQDASAAMQLAQLNWMNINNTPEHSAGLAQVTHWLEVAKQSGSAKASRYLAQIEQSTPYFLPYSRYQQSVSNAYHPLNCAMQIQPVVSSLAQWSRVSAYIQQFKTDESLQNLPVCFNAPVVISEQQLQCDKFSQNQQRILCDEYQLATMLSPVPFSHILIMSQQGKANVHNGILYLDEQDSYKVMLHELAHFAGLIDEYPLSQGLAAQFCNKEQVLPNLLIVKKSSSTEQKIPKWPQQWSASADEKLYKARTCDNTPYQAYKPFAGLSFMEFYDAGTKPHWYMAAWAQQINHRKNLIPAFVNFAQSASEQGDKTSADLWWQRYQDYINE
ncbi:hypothetical protein [Neptunicella marina]|uniref:Uncharacterized protein n=1 Tax=Neptunicella marina TaxID=2125989 RepID=A0A8J6IKT8_9ALTE|nr:hypothetical protein [Neptunicella marina]MBC3764575.1 hypothetical protein [Neptunicella marina]